MNLPIMSCIMSSFFFMGLALPFNCQKFYCLSNAPCGVPLPNCVRGHQPADLKWLRMHEDGKHVIGMAPNVHAGSDYVLDLGHRCSLIIRVQPADEDIPSDVCIAANNVSDDYFNKNC